MRKTLVQYLIENDDENTYFLTSDVGYNVLEPLREKMGDRFINVGIAEQSMIGIAAGLALSGKKVYTYTMCAFYLRCIEHIKLDICYQNLPIIMIGVGVGFDYEHLGTTHFALEDAKIMKQLHNIEVVSPVDKSELKSVLKKLRNTKKPTYLRLSRVGENREFNYEFKKYPKEGGSFEYFKKTYQSKNED